jgi:hypothetical protein
MIISRLDKSGGFFSVLFFAMNHYIYCKKNNINFIIESTNWMFLYKLGWEDYFYNIDIVDNILTSDIKSVGFFDILQDFNIFEYKKYLWDFYKYNATTNKKIIETKQDLNLINNQYGSIFVRRGDKLYGESKIFDSKLYIQMLLEKAPDCRTVFLQTDDYTCYEEIGEYIVTNGLDITMITLCNKKCRGALISRSPGQIHTNIRSNEEYINKIRNDLQGTVEVINMNKEQVYEHTIDMIIGLDIVFHSSICVLDYQSNVSRFIKLAHDNIDRVFDVNCINMDLNKTVCPAYPTSVYEDPDTYIHN